VEVRFVAIADVSCEVPSALCQERTSRLRIGDSNVMAGL